MSNRAVFLDRDGTMAIDVPYCRRPDDFHLFPGTVKAIRLLKKHGFKIIVITNQSGIARGYFTEETLAEIHHKMADDLAHGGTEVDAIYYCPHHPDDNCDCRKPGTALILQAARDFTLNLELCYMVGDMPVDIGLGKAVGCRTILVASDLTDNPNKPDAVAPDIYQAALAILGMENGLY
jgi:histidinol-phosphate phosphatase family protein